MKFSDEPTRTNDLLNLYRKNKKIYQTKKIRFLGIQNNDVYNISACFTLGNAQFIAGRVEKRDSEISHVAFFKRIEDDLYLLDPKATIINHYQDPAITFIGDEVIVGGTHIEVEESSKSQHITSWNTAFYRGKNLESLNHFANAPKKMKDVRFIKYQDKIALFSRPQGGVAGPGKIGFIMLDSLDDVTPSNIQKAVMLTTHFVDDEWGGANELHILKNGLIGVLGHISTRDPQLYLHYYPMVFAFDPITLKSTKVKIIAERLDFLDGPSKRKDLKDVLFSGGIVRKPHGKAILYTGVSDVEAHYIEIDDPFLEYENSHLDKEESS
jgi:hypothetical protein